MMNHIEKERPDHEFAIHELLAAAFPTDSEAEVVDELRAAGAPPVSLVAVESDSILGHVSFSPVSIQSPLGVAAVVWALAPLATSPAARGRGIGSALVRAGLRACADAGCDAVVVLGDPHFYRQFGFLCGGQRGLRCSFDVPTEAFMFIELRAASVPFHQGTVYFHSALDRFSKSNQSNPDV